MSKASTAAQELEWLGEKLGGLIALAPELKRLGTLDKLEAEIQTRVDRLKKDEERILASFRQRAVNDAKDEIHQAQLSANVIREKADKDGQDIVAKAQEEATEIRAKASLELTGAREQRNNAATVVRNHMKQVQDWHDAREAELEQHKARVAEVHALVAEEERKLAAVQKRLADLKASL